MFAMPWYLDAVCEGDKDGWEVVLIEKGGKTVGVLPYYWRHKGPFRVMTMPHLTKFLGVYFHPEFQNPKQQHKICVALIEQLPKLAHFQQNFAYGFTDWLPFYWAGYRQSTHYSYVLNDLSDLDQVFAGFSADYRNQKIRKAQETIRITTERSLREFYDVETMSFQRQTLAFPFSYDYFKKYDDILAEHDARHIFFAVDQEDRIHSVLYLLVDHDRVYYHMAGDNPALRSSGAAILLVWEAIRFTRNKLQKNIFDFEGSMIQSIERVRRQFGAKQVPYFKIEKHHSRLLKWIDGF